MELKLDIKSSDILKEAKEKVRKQLNSELERTIKGLGSTAYKHAQKLADERLSKNLSEKYKENLYIEHISENVIVVGIRPEALWIEEGRKSGFMSELLKNGKTSKDGSKYKVIPFEHSTQESKNPVESDSNLAGELKSFLKSKKVPHSKSRGLILDEKGSPRIGRTHTFDIKQGAKLSANLQNVSVYQKLNAKTNKVERKIMTFRVISEKHKEEGKWTHPGRPPEDILKETYDWVKDIWQKEILPGLKDKYESR